MSAAEDTNVEAAEGAMLEWIGFTLIQADIEEKILGKFVFSALKSGFEEGKVEDDTKEQLVELLQSASPDNQDPTGMVQNICTTYEQYRVGEKIPEVPRSRHHLLLLSENEGRTRNNSESSTKSNKSDGQNKLSATAYEFVPGSAPPQVDVVKIDPDSYDSGISTLGNQNNHADFETWPPPLSGMMAETEGNTFPAENSNPPSYYGVSMSYEQFNVSATLSGGSQMYDQADSLGDQQAYTSQDGVGYYSADLGLENLTLESDGPLYAEGYVKDNAMESVDTQRQLRTLLRSIEDALDDEDFEMLLQLDDKSLEEALLMFLDRGDLEPDDPNADVSKIPCKYYIMGKCFRADCWYSHDLKRIPCKHLAAGWCSNGDACQFGHDDRVLVRTAMAALRGGYRATHLTEEYHDSSENENPPDLTPQSFPPLGQSSASVGEQLPPESPWIVSSDPDKLDLATKLKMKQLKETFPTLWDDDVTRHLRAAKGDLNVATRTLSQEYPGSYVQPKPKETAQSEKMGMYRKGNTKVIDWVETGMQLGSQYRDLRAQAIQNAQARNRFLQEATGAYMRGDKQAARDLSRKGRHYDQLMREQHREAAQILFKSRNNGGKPKDVLDLHGLHVQEALAFLEVYLSQAQTLFTTCYIITGTGHHSEHKHLQSKKQARLAPAVQQYLDDGGYTFRDASAKHGGRGGMFEVTLR
eukprot:m.11111 g.11111  ORF g.11111 m.11111 type:complete len:697 (+) comp4376_c0_seq1:327-2417(+)